MKIVLLSVLITIYFYTCAAQTVAPIKCGPNETFDKCGPSCPETCESKLYPPPPCVQSCRRGCFCNLGYVRNTAGECVPTGECWPKPAITGKN
ncbi:hypothetical protein pipiens_004073 [Culex pipiens pipiens]|uniref:TIL domain-containing protein n=1 Tax=Culex pipiens pipiens TaxID=38569 RepID=A0ABD1CQ82_CULPP